MLESFIASVTMSAQRNLNLFIYEDRMGRRLPLKPQADFIKRIAQAAPVDAIEELIWNGLDEHATEVVVALEESKLGDVVSVRISDNGRGLSFEAAGDAFSSLGNSQKVSRVLESGQPLHGRLGQGRHKALSLGKKVVWEFTYKKSDGSLWRYGIEGTSGEVEPFYLMDERPCDVSESTGCVVTISAIDKPLGVLASPKARRDLTGRFAHFLLAHSDRTITFFRKPIRPKDVIARQRKLRPLVVTEGDNSFVVHIQIVEWNAGHSNRDAFLCGKSGIPLQKLGESFLPGADERSVFIKSDLFDSWHQENLLQTLEVSGDPNRKEIIRDIRKQVRRDYQRQRQRNAYDMIERLKNEGSYPYRRDPVTEIEAVERKVFDVCAVSIGRHLPSFEEGMDIDSRKLMLRMVQEAISQSPSTVGKIIREVCKLPVAEAEKFSALLDDVPLSKIVDASHRVAQRLEFLKLFKAAVYLDPFIERIKERTQLQKLLAENLWLFGEEYAMGTDDKDIEAVLKRHMSILERDDIAPLMSEEEFSLLMRDLKDSTKGKEESYSRIPDFMVWRQFKERRADEYEFLVIEIKRPGVPVGHKELRQVETYARAVMKSGVVNKERSRWVFIVVSDHLTEEIDERASQENLPRYTVSRPKGETFEVRAMPWNAIIQSAEGRHEHLRTWLRHNVDMESALVRATKTYEQFLPPRSGPRKERNARNANGRKRRPTGK